jgi:drug/metabolite transporter (DMT)-like permease
MYYLFGFVLVFLEKIIVSISNVFDGELSRNTFKSVWTIVILNGLLIIPALPIIFLILVPKAINISQVFLILVIAMIEVFYQIPYYKALQNTDTSVVTSLFGFGRIFTPLFAYFIIKEVLSPLQYIGFAIIVIASILTSFDRRTFKINRAFYFMVPVAILLAFQDVIQKAGLEQIDWKTFYFWSMALSLPFYLLLLLVVRSARGEISNFIKNPFKKKFIPLYGQNLALWISGGFGTLALSLLPVTIIKAFGSFHSLFVHIVAVAAPKTLKVKGESFSWKKVYLFILMGIGILFTLGLKF